MSWLIICHIQWKPVVLGLSLGTPRFVKHQCTKLIFKNISIWFHVCMLQTHTTEAVMLDRSDKQQFFKSVFTVFRKSTYCMNGLLLVFSTKYTVIGKSILTRKKWHTSHLNLVFSKFTTSMRTLTISHTIQHEKQVSTFLWMIATRSHISSSFSHLCINKM